MGLSNYARQALLNSLLGKTSNFGALASALAALGASRICPLGTMQAPPLAWCHDGRGVLAPLARFCDREA